MEIMNNMNTMHEIELCEVCGNDNLLPVLNLGLNPMCDDLVSIGDSRACKEYPIEILFCQTCRTGHQRFQVPKKDLFPKTYHYRSRFTADVLNGMSELVDSCVQLFGDLTGKKILDIGCNDGSLLDFFHKKGGITFGIEPTGAFVDAEVKGHVVFNDFLSEEVARDFVSRYGQPDFITFTNVFAHIENLQQVIDALKLLSSAHTVIVIENHYLGAVFTKNQFDTFYHEHPRTYSYTSFMHICTSLGVELLGVEFPARYGGNIRVFMGNAALVKFSRDESFYEKLNERESGFHSDYLTLSQNVENWCANKKVLIQELVRNHGKLRAKAFPGRAAILIKLLDLDENIIDAVYEKPGSLKIGHYLPGTRIPIKSDSELFGLVDQNQPVLNLAWHIPSEIRAYLSAHGYKGAVIDILTIEDCVATKSSKVVAHNA